MVPPLGDLLVDMEKSVLEELFLPMLRILIEFERNSGAFRQALDRLNEVQILVLFNEGKNISAFVASKTMKSLFAWIDMEARRLLPMKRAERGKTGSGPLERNDRRNDINNVIGSANLFKGRWRDEAGHRDWQSIH